jgi:chromosome transmission fidelity protein 1
LLLQKSARDALDLSLKGHVIVVDEAHNLMDAIAGIYSVSVTLDQVQQARAQVTAYLLKFRNKLKGQNRVYVAQIVRILDSIISYLQSKFADAKATDGVADIGALMSGKGVDQINIYKLCRYLQESRLARKVDGYTTYSEQSQQDAAKDGSNIEQLLGRPPRTKTEPDLKETSRKVLPAKRELLKKVKANGDKVLGGINVENSGAKQHASHTVPVLTHVQSFMVSLMSPSAEGRFFYSREETGIVLKYMLLDPTFHFKEIVEDARAVVLAGGTMSPVSLETCR